MLCYYPLIDKHLYHFLRNIICPKKIREAFSKKNVLHLLYTPRGNFKRVKAICEGKTENKNQSKIDEGEKERI